MDASKSSSEEVKNVDVYTAKGLFSTGYRYLDVSAPKMLELANSFGEFLWTLKLKHKTKEEFQKGHVEGALNIPYMFVTEEGRVKNQDFIAQVLEVSKKDDKLVVACNRGGRGLKATIDLKNEGYEHVANIEGGYSAWVDAGFAGENAEKTACKFHP